jgi:hypothetical protein
LLLRTRERPTRTKSGAGVRNPESIYIYIYIDIVIDIGFLLSNKEVETKARVLHKRNDASAHQQGQSTKKKKISTQTNKSSRESRNEKKREATRPTTATSANAFPEPFRTVFKEAQARAKAEKGRKGRVRTLKKKNGCDVSSVPLRSSPHPTPFH